MNLMTKICWNELDNQNVQSPFDRAQFQSSNQLTNQPLYHAGYAQQASKQTWPCCGHLVFTLKAFSIRKTSLHRNYITSFSLVLPVFWFCSISRHIIFIISHLLYIIVIQQSSKRWTSDNRSSKKKDRFLSHISPFLTVVLFCQLMKGISLKICILCVHVIKQ